MAISQPIQNKYKKVFIGILPDLKKIVLEENSEVNDAYLEIVDNVGQIQDNGQVE